MILLRRRFISYRQFAGVEFVWNIDNRRPAVYYTVHYNWSDLLLDKNVIAHQTNQFSLQYLHQQRKNWRSCFVSSIFISTHKSARQVFDCSHHWTQIHRDNLIPPHHRTVIPLRWSILIYFLFLHCCSVLIVPTVKFPY